MGRIAYFGRRDQNANANPVAPGNTFNLRFKLFERATQNIEVRLIPQRIVFNIGGFSEIQPLDPIDYFSQQPNAPFTIRRGDQEIVIGPYQIKPQNSGNSLTLPQDILFTAYIPDLNTPGEQESRTHCLSIAEPARNRLAADPFQFSGTSNSHDLHEALDAAIAAAKNGLQSTLINWQFLSAEGEDGGFAQVHRLKVWITASVP